MTTRQRLAIIGLGMAVRPHARSLVDLRDRVEVAYAFSRSKERRDSFGAQFDFPLTGDLSQILEDRSIDAVMILTPPNSHLELVEAFAAAGKHILLEKPLERSSARAQRLVEAAEAAGVTLGVVLQNRFRPASEHLRAQITAGAAGRSHGGQRAVPLVAAAKLLRPARPRHARARRRRRADHPGDPRPRSDAEPDRAGRRGRRDRRHHGAASDGDGRFRRRRAALCQWCAGRPDGDLGRLSGSAGADRADRHQGVRHADRGRGHDPPSRRPPGERGRGAEHRRRRRPDGFPPRRPPCPAGGFSRCDRAGAATRAFPAARR